MVFVCFCYFTAFRLKTPKGTSGWSQETPRAPKRAPRWTQERPKRPQDGPKRPQDGPKSAQDGPKSPQEAAREGPRRPKTAPARPQVASGSLPSRIQKASYSRKPFKKRPRVPRTPKRSPRGRQELPGGPQEAPKRPPRAPQAATKQTDPSDCTTTLCCLSSAANAQSNKNTMKFQQEVSANWYCLC